MAPDPAPAPGGAGDYAGWTWQQIQAAINAGQPQTMHDAGTHFEEAKTKLDDVAKNSAHYRDTLSGPDGLWKGPAADAFNGLMTEMITDVQEHADSLTPYKGALDDAGDALTDAQTDVGNAITDAGQDTIERYNNDVQAYNTAAAAYNAGNGPAPVNPGPAPYVQGADGGQAVDVSRYPEIEEALNEKMRQIIATLAGQYGTAGGQLTEPGVEPPPTPADEQPPPNLNDEPAPDLPPPAAPPPPVEAPPPLDGAPPPDLAPPLPPAALAADGALPDGALPDGALAPPLPFAEGAVPPGPDEIGPLAPGFGNMALVTRPGGLADLPPNALAVPPPQLAPLDPAAGPTPFDGFARDLPGARFDGVLGDRPLLAPANGLVQPGDLPLSQLVAENPTGTIGGPPAAGVPNTLLGAAPLGFATLQTGLTQPSAYTGDLAAQPGVLGAPDATPANNGLFAPGQQHLTEVAPASAPRGAGTGGTGSIPPMTGMAGGGYGGMMSTGPDPEGRMFLDDVFGENEEELAKAKERSLVGGPRNENGAPFAVSPYGISEEEKEREREGTDPDDMWGSVAGTTSLGR